VIDGEIVCIDGHGKPQFRDLLLHNVSLSGCTLIHCGESCFPVDIRIYATADFCISFM